MRESEVTERGREAIGRLSDVSYGRITPKGMAISAPDGAPRTPEADTILITLPLEPNSGAYESLEGSAPEVYSLGDCKKPGLIIDAIADGFMTGRAV